MEPIGTIESGDEIEYFDESEDELEEKVYSAKDRKETAGVFTEGFTFDEEDPFLDPIGIESGLSMVKKKVKKTLTLDEKIKAMINEDTLRQPTKKSETQETEGDEEMEVDEEVEEAEEDEVGDDLDIMTKDEVKLKKTSIKKKKTEDDEFFEEWQRPDDDEDENSGDFNGYKLDRKILRALGNNSWNSPTEIQKGTIPVAMAGRDICACATTGSGKTGAFVIPILQRFALADGSAPSCTRVLVLLPTRELCVQVYSVFKKLAADLDNCDIACAAGGLDIHQQTSALRRDPDILVATPGRLIDHLHNTPNFSLRDIEILVLDEADRMLDEFFASQMNEILSQTCPERQTLLFSATMSDKVKDLVAVSLNNPVKIFISSNTDVARGLEQQFVRIRDGREGDREAIVASLLTRYFPKHTLLFTQTKRQAHRMHIVLGLIGLKVAELHGSLSQTQRLESLANFKNGKSDILICTDVAARGLDIPSVRTVINMTLPNNYKSYVHRVGRTARAGAKGKSISLVGESERNMLKVIVKSAKSAVKSRTVDVEAIQKFREKLEELEPKIKKIIVMENEEAAFRAAENQINRTQNKLDGTHQKRDWYQTKYERELEKAQTMLDRHSELKNKNTRNKKVIKRADTAEERAKREVEKAAAFRKREEKRQKRGNRIRAVGSEAAQAKVAAAKAIALAKANGGGKKKPKSGFTKDLADVSSKNIKKHRYVAHKDRSTETKGRGGIKKPGKQQKGGRSIPKKGGKVTKKGRK